MLPWSICVQVTCGGELLTLDDFHFLLTFVARYHLEIPFALPRFFAVLSTYSNWSLTFCSIASGEMCQHRSRINLQIFLGFIFPQHQSWGVICRRGKRGKESSSISSFRQPMGKVAFITDPSKKDIPPRLARVKRRKEEMRMGFRAMGDPLCLLLTPVIGASRQRTCRQLKEYSCTCHLASGTTKSCWTRRGHADGTTDSSAEAASAGCRCPWPEELWDTRKDPGTMAQP